MDKDYNREVAEQKWKEYWALEHIFKFDHDPEKPLFSVDTPPPYVSADHLHAGHIMSYAQAEFIVRYKRMRGYNVFYPMGFDDNGLPTERFVEKKYAIDKSKISKSEFVKLCLKETEIGSETYKKLWNDLGISVDWTKTYSTISPLATRVSQWSVIDLHKKGALYRAEAPVLWCPLCRTAIAEADLEDKEDISNIHYINFMSEAGGDLTIATTRPEFLSACVALYVNPSDPRYQKIIGAEARVPIFGYAVPILPSTEVSMEFGTGLMMVCTWGDKEDVEKWQRDKLATRALIREDGSLNELGGDYAGLQILEARERIISELKAKGYLMKQESITHTLHVHERCGTPAEFILSKQWFIKIADLKDVWLDMGKKLNWYPESKFKDYELWVNSIKWDWCISRQRYYGVPLPIWYCAKCDEPLFANEGMLPVYPTEEKRSLGECSKCGHGEFVPETDVMDTWATSSCTPFLLRELVDDKGVKEQLFPMTLRPNAFEIIRTWDFYSIVKGYYHFKEAPFEDVMISGHGLDEAGRKIAKRLGNYVPSEELLKEYGADAIRYWATGAMLGQNLRFNTQEIKKGKKTTIKLWNVARFILMNLDGYDFAEGEPCLEHADLWIIQELNTTMQNVTHAFETYTYAAARDEVETFFWSKFADYYIEFVKYRLLGNDLKSKRAAQYALSKVFLAILKLYAPILPFVTEELYQRVFKDLEGSRSIHLSPWPQPIAFGTTLDILDFNGVLAAVDEIRKYKSEHNLSLGTELESYVLKTAVNLRTYGDFIKSVLRVKLLHNPCS